MPRHAGAAAPRRADHGGEPVGGVRRRVRLDPGPHAQPRPLRARRAQVHQRLRHRDAHRARARGARRVGTPPVPGQSIVRRPDNEHLATVGGLLERQGYATSFVYGGYGYFDNMNAYFGGNDYRVDRPRRLSRSRRSCSRTSGASPTSRCSPTCSRDRRQRGARQAVVHARHDDVEPPAVHLSRRPDRHPLARRARRRRQVHRLGDRQVHRRRAGEALVRRDAVRDRRRPLRVGRRQDQAAGGRLPDPADLLRAEARRAGRVHAD